MDTYIIIYSFIVNECPGAGGNNIMVSVDGSLRQHNLTGLQENSVHGISITARNSTGDSAPSDQIQVTTPTAGTYIAVGQ